MTGKTETRPRPRRRPVPGPGKIAMDYQGLFEDIARDLRCQRNLDWGEPRHGHPEGSVRAHVAAVDRNVEALRARLSSDADYWRLRVLALVHDAFKAEADPGVPITDPRSHASLARAFLASYCDNDPDLLAMAQFHDEPYALWRQFRARGRCDPARLNALLATIRDWNLFLAFLIADGSTAGKGREPLHWFFGLVGSRVAHPRFTADDIL